MDYEQLRTQLKNERNTHKLTKIHDKFYEELETLVKMEEDFYKLRSKKVCAMQIKRLRLNKIIEYAKRTYPAKDEELENMNKEEEEFYKECLNLFNKWINKVKL